MPALIYQNEGFLQGITIETEGDTLILRRRNISGEKTAGVKIPQITRVKAEKGVFSYSLLIEIRGEEPVSIGGLDRAAVEELQKTLGSIMEIRAAREKETMTLEQARKEAGNILENLGADFDARHILSYLVNQAVQLDSSDIHITPGKDTVSVGYRMDGLLRETARFARDFHPRLLAALKNRAKLPSYKKSTPQDGSFHFDEGGLDLDVRCATIPTLFGEKIVMRILNTGKRPLFLEDLGLSPSVLAEYQKIISSPQGCVILTGPAGSGKTTTIFASLIHLYNSYEGTVNIATIEDPAEYIIEEFQQTQVNPAVGLTFAAGLKSLLRLDPDILMVGEIRDPETARTAVRTALTGHLIFTTLHSRDSRGVFPRLMEMDVKPGMISSAVTAVLYQRLLRKLCPHCRYETAPPPEMLREMDRRRIKPGAYFTSKGCPECSHTRYRGRTGVFELLNVDEKIRDMLVSGNFTEITDYCQKHGMRFLRDDALEKVAKGITDMEEVRRLCPGGE